MQTFIFGLLLASVSGISVLAFKHPNGFARLFPYLFAAATILFICITVWHAAVEITWMNLVQYLMQDSRPDAENAKTQLTLPYAWVGFSYLGVVSYLWVIVKLPPFLQVTDKSEST